MRLRELLTGIDCELLWGDEETGIEGICADSRQARPGWLFVCLIGAKEDGHKYVQNAIDGGAAAILTCQGENGILAAMREDPNRAKTCKAIIHTGDTRSALAYLAARWYSFPERELVTIGITGTKGKTTTAYMVKSILENAGRRVGLIGTNEVIIGRKHMEACNTTPEPLLLQGYLREMVEHGLDTVVMEVSSQAIKQKRTEGMDFDYGIFTNLSPDHVAPHEHKDFQEYLECKSKLFRQCRYGIVNGDDACLNAVTQGATCILETYGLGEKCMLRAENVQYRMQEGKPGVSFRVTGSMEFDAYLPLPGIFSVYNALAAISICRHFRVRESDVQRSLLAAKVKGRIEVVEGPKDYTILIDYAHNPMALACLLETLRAYHPKRLICLFGCGGDRPAMRRKSMGRISGRLADLTVITDDNPRNEDPAEIRALIMEGVKESDGESIEIADRREAIKYCMEHAKAGDMIVLAGKGHETRQEISGEFHPMDEREIVRTFLTT